MTNQFPSLLETIADMTWTEIEAVTTPESAERGLQYFKQSRVRGFTWDSSRRLKVEVMGSELYEVTMALHKAAIQTVCTCPAWSHYSHCKHAVCAFLTMRHLVQTQESERLPHEQRLAFQLFSFPEIEPPGEAPLSEPLLSEEALVPESETFQIHLSCGPDKGMRLGFKEGKSFLGTYSKKIPKIFRKFLRDAESGVGTSGQAEEPLREFLNHPEKDFELWVYTPKGPKAAKWEAGRKLHFKTHLDLVPEGILIRRLAESGGQAIEQFLRIGETLFFDISQGILSPLPLEDAWLDADRLEGKHFFSGEDSAEHFSNRDSRKESFFRDLFEARDLAAFEPDHEPFLISLHAFESRPMVVSSQETARLSERITFSVQGAPSPLLENSYVLRVSLLKDEDPAKMRWKLEGRLGGRVVDFESHPLLARFQVAMNDKIDFRDLRSGDKEIVREAMCKLALDPGQSEKKREEITRDTMRQFQEYGWVRSAARRHLKAFCSFMDGTPEALQIAPSGDSWVLAKTPVHPLIKAFALSFLLLGKEVTNFSEGLRAAVSKKRISAGLIVLKKELEAMGVELFFDQKAVRISRLDFSVDASKKTEAALDWFEIRPEIKLDGRSLSQAEWEALLGSNGLLIKDDTVEVVDANSQELLGKLDRFLTGKVSSKKSRLESKEYVRVKPLEIFDWLLLRKLGIEVKLTEEDESRLSRLLRFQKLPVKNIPGKLHGTLRDYQKEGYDWLAFLYEHHLGACLADDMGLGKTVQAIAFLAGLKELQIPETPDARSLPHLVVMPASLVFNWEAEIQKFYPDFKTFLYVGLERAPVFEGYDVVLTTYDLLRRDIEKFKALSFHVILYDEAQMVKNLFSARANAVRALKGRFKICMTGTPLENHLGEYYSVMDLCVPGIFGEYENFRTQLKQDEMGALVQRTRPFVLRRTKDKILKELPPKVESDIYLSLTDQQKLLYAKTVAEVKGNIDLAYRNKSEAQARVIALTGMLRLRQICVSPKLVDPKIEERSPKIEYLLTKLCELKEENHAALIFSQFTSFFDILEPELRKEKIDFYRLDGQTPLPKRREQVQAFQQGKGPSMFLISLKAGGFGLNLTRANYVFHMDPWWNPAVDRQASDRAHRIGQEKTVFVQRVLMRHTIEEKVMALRHSKWELFQAVMNDETADLTAAPLSRQDFEFLLSE